MRSSLSAVAIALAITVLAGVAWSEDVKATPSPADFMKVMAEAAKPGPEHSKLQPLTGTWNYTCKFWMDPSQAPIETKGTAERKWILGGRFLEEKYSGTGFDGKPGFEGVGLIGYDNGQQKFTATWVSNMCTGTCAGTGESDASGRKFTFHKEAYCPVMKQTIKSRDELRIESDDKTVAESYVLQDGKEVKMMEIVATRKK